MPITERKAIAIMFEDLQEEKRQLKQNYRNDITAIEARQDRLLEKLSRLDDIEREAIDAEGTLTQLCQITQDLAALIPQVPAGDVINAAAEKMAAAAHETGAQIFTDPNKKQYSNVNEQETFLNIAAEKRTTIPETAPGVKKPYRVADVIEEIEIILKESKEYLTAREIETALKNKFGWEWNAFTTNFSGWRTQYPNSIVKHGRSYTVEKESEAREYGRKPSLQDEINKTAQTV